MWEFKRNILKSSQDEVSVVSFSHYFTTANSSSSTTACSLNVFNMTLYSPESALVDSVGTIIAVDQRLYTNSSLTSLFNGGNFYYHYYSSEVNGTAIRIASSGVMVSSVSCG